LYVDVKAAKGIQAAVKVLEKVRDDLSNLSRAMARVQKAVVGDFTLRQGVDVYDHLLVVTAEAGSRASRSRNYCLCISGAGLHQGPTRWDGLQLDKQRRSRVVTSQNTRWPLTDRAQPYPELTLGGSHPSRIIRIDCDRHSRRPIQERSCR
jgi:hypothetical protein